MTLIKSNISKITVPPGKSEIIAFDDSIPAWPESPCRWFGHLDLKRDAAAAWKRFIWCLRSLPAHEAAPLWQAALAEVAAA
jgi:hypothetical protein